MSKFIRHKIIKKDGWGHIAIGEFIDDDKSCTAIKRSCFSAKWWLKPIARVLAHNEKKALFQLEGLSEDYIAVPKILESGKGYHIRSFVEATPMYVEPPTDPKYYSRAKKLLRDMRKLGVCSNDLAKESNWLVTDDMQPVLIDFQLAIRSKRQGCIFRMIYRDDLRHLLKHKRRYCPDFLTAKEKQILKHKSCLNKFWMLTGRKLYRFYTRKILGWEKRKGPHDRGAKLS